MPADLMLVDAAPNDTFSAPLAVRAPNDGSGRLFVVEQCGTIRIIKNGVVNATPFLTLNVACNRLSIMRCAYPPKAQSR